jgi:hypothetical protein
LVLVVLVFPDAASVRQTPEFEKSEFDRMRHLTPALSPTEAEREKRRAVWGNAFSAAPTAKFNRS